MATTEHFRGKNSTVAQYSLGYKHNQQVKYIGETRNIKENKLLINNSSNFNQNKTNDDTIFNFNESLNYDKSLQDNSLLLKNDSKKHRFSSKVENSSNPTKPGDTSKCRNYATVIFVMAFLAIAALVIFCIVYFGVLTTMPTYLQPCSTSNPCVYFKNLFCNGTCICGSDQYWNGTMCTNLITFGGSCTNTYQCDSGLTCSNSICQCTNTTYYTGGGCVSKIAYSFACLNCNYTNCSNCYPCSQCQDYSYGYCNTSYFLCMCSAGAFYDVGTGLCLKNSSFNQACLSSTQCDSTKGLTCSSTGSCVCKQSGYFYSNINQICNFCPWTIANYDNLQTCITDFSSSYAADSFSTVQSYCSTFGSHILRLNSSSLNEIIKSFLLKKDLFYWLDATDSTVENSYIWNSYTGSPGYTIDTTIIPWCTNQPDGGINENCLALAPMDWCLVDLPCTSAKLYAVCQFKN